MPKRPLEDWWQSLFPGTPAQVPRRSYRGGSATPSSGRGYVRPSDTPIANARSPVRYRWVSFGRAPRSRAYNPSYVPITNDPDSALQGGDRPRVGSRAVYSDGSRGAFSTPDSTPAPTESQGETLGRLQAFEIESPLAVPEATSAAFAPLLLEAAAGMFAGWALSLIPNKEHKWDAPDWFDRLIDIIRRHGKKDPAPVPHHAITGTPQPKATCHPGFPNAFTAGLGSPIAAS